MPGYVILDLEIFDQQEFEEYKKLAPASIAAFDGKFKVRGGQIISLEGGWTPERIVIIEFPSIERAQEWYHSELYTKASIYRNKAAKSKIILLEGV